MHRVSDSPIVSFSRDGEVFELGRSGTDPVLHMYGSTGLGVAPVSIASSERLAGDGSVVRGVRYDRRDVFIPLFMEAPSTGELSRVRRELAGLLAPHRGPVEVRVQDPATGTDRMIRGYYREGLDGDFGDGFHGFWQTLGLTFECPDPWWLGPERTQSLQLNPGSKPFLSEGEVSRRNLVPSPFGSGASGVDYWRTVRGELSSSTDDGEFAARFVKDATDGQSYLDPSTDYRPRAESTFRFSVDMKTSSRVKVGLRVRAYGGAEGEAALSYVFQAPGDGWVRRSVEAPVEAMPDGGYLRALVHVDDIEAGDSVLLRRAMVEVDPPEDDPYFDGDSLGCKWVGGADGPESVMWDSEKTAPFFPVILAESVVQGSWTVDVGGEGPVSPVWEVRGPGTDLRIIRGADRIEIDGEIRDGETLLIDAAAGRITPDRWDDVSLRSRLFDLNPGVNNIQVSMVGATEETLVRLVYRERHLEGV